MPLKLTICASRKVGTANFGSRGASVGLELEIDSSLIDEPQQLHHRIDGLFRLAAEAVSRELNVHGAREALHSMPNGMPNGRESALRPATANQIRAIHAIANRQNLDLTAELRKNFGVYRADDLMRDQASRMIDVLNASPNGAAGQS